jgi:ABC-type antimicrobial peptide transport system permease subunit
VVRLKDEYAAELMQPRRTAVAGLIVAGLALVTATAGLFSLLTFMAHQRQREFGVRAALGASPASLRATVFGHGLRITVAGVVAGSVLGWIGMRSLSMLQYRVPASDPLTWSCACAMLIAIVTIASWAPARSASRTDPVDLLRAV